jgi:adenosylhomocysteine nucleosidase
VTLVVVTGLAAEARIARAPGVTTLIGAGRSDRLAAELEAAIAGGARRLLSFGVAGALAPHLKPGDLIVGRALIDGVTHTPCDPAWSAAMMDRLARAPSSLRAERSNPEIEAAVDPRIGMAGVTSERRDGERRQIASVTISGLLRSARNDDSAMSAFFADIAGVDALVAEPAAKAALHLSSGAAAVDMESGVVARAAARHRLPFSILRAIADPAHRALPPAALVAMRADGGIDLAAILRALTREPRQLPALTRLALEARRAFGALARARALLGADFAGVDFGEL